MKNFFNSAIVLVVGGIFGAWILTLMLAGQAVVEIPKWALGIHFGMAVYGACFAKHLNKTTRVHMLLMLPMILVGLGLLTALDEGAVMKAQVLMQLVIWAVVIFVPAMTVFAFLGKPEITSKVGLSDETPNA